MHVDDVRHAPELVERPQGPRPLQPPLPPDQKQESGADEHRLTETGFGSLDDLRDLDSAPPQPSGSHNQADGRHEQGNEQPGENADRDDRAAEALRPLGGGAAGRVT